MIRCRLFNNVEIIITKIIKGVCIIFFCNSMAYGYIQIQNKLQIFYLK